MSRIAKKPILIPKDVKINIFNKIINIIGKNGNLNYIIHKNVTINIEKNLIFFSVIKNNKYSWSQAGTTRAIINSLIIGVTIGFFKKLKLFGVGYKANIKNNNLTLSLGFSHLINYKLPNGVFINCLNKNEILLNSSNKQLIGQVAAEIRLFHTPDPYKGKGIRYDNEIIKLKETKKK
ncbi:MAG: 50S ribosomal protein L6 [Enterobacteriaceae bacterium PSpicST2]|nr:MAG: 50S ribosomal protein L6 [Enterobacteriaceae bacterium PSpicST2]WMC18984.1 MAG: 50S ribosomal protein L6 [Enterobacteriaceae bacterium PSpicST1]